MKRKREIKCERCGFGKEHLKVVTEYGEKGVKCERCGAWYSTLILQLDALARGS